MMARIIPALGRPADPSEDRHVDVVVMKEGDGSILADGEHKARVQARDRPAFAVRGRPLVQPVYLQAPPPAGNLGIIGNAVKYVNFTHWIDVIGLAACGLTWLMARVFLFCDPDSTLTPLNPDTTKPGSLPGVVTNAALNAGAAPGEWSTWVWQTIMFVSMVVFLVVLALHIAKAVVYGPKQLWFEFGIPFVGHCFVLFPATMYCYVIAARFFSSPDSLPYPNALGVMASFPKSLTGTKASDDATKAIFWIAGPMQIIATLLTYYRWFTRPHGIGSLNVTWLLPFAADTLGAAAFGIAGPEYNLAAWLFFSFGLFNWTIIMTLLAYKHFFGNNPLGPLPSAYVFIANPAVLCVAWNVLTAPGLPGTAEFHSTLASLTSPVYKNPWQSGIVGLFNWNAGGQVFYWVAMTFFFFCILLELRNPIWKRPFNRLYYIYIFPLNCVSITTISYHGWVNTNLTKAMAAATLIIASVATFLVFAFSAYYFFKNERIFFDLAPAITQPVATLPSAELHAASLVAAHVSQKLSHENPGLQLNDARANLEDLCTLLRENLKQEDLVYGPVAASLYPRAAADLATERRVDLEMASSALSAVNSAIACGGGSDTRRELTKNAAISLQRLSEVLNQHRNSAAAGLANTVGNNALAADLLKRAWGVTPLPEWRTIVALIGSALPVPDAVGFFGFLARTLPEYSALVGAWLYESIEKEKFDVIVGAAPELVPAGTPGYAPYWS